MKKLLYLDWYKEFQCVGGACPLTCCGRWNIAITEKEIEQYKAMSHPFGKEVLEALDEENKQMKQENGRCKLLTEDGWCSLVLECGEEYLSYTCTVFPRMADVYGDIVEARVEIVCPLVARYLLRPQKICFGIEEIEGEVVEEVDYELYDALSLGRSCLIEIFQAYDEKYYTGKLYILLMLLNATAELHEKGNLNKESMGQLLSRYGQEENCHAVFQAGEQIEERIELKAKKMSECLLKLMQTKGLEHLLAYINADHIGNIATDLQMWITDLGQFQKDIQGFLFYFRNHYICLVENFFVYALYTYWIPEHLRMEEFGQRIKAGVIELMVIQLCAMSVWKEKGEIATEDYEVIISGIDRMLAHSKDVFQEISNFLQKEEEDSVAALLLFLIC